MGEHNNTIVKFFLSGVLVASKASYSLFFLCKACDMHCIHFYASPVDYFSTVVKLAEFIRPLFYMQPLDTQMPQKEL